MIDHYNAFISYKHADIDNKIAKEVQQSLERFSIPGKIKKKTGVKKINRVFRDKDELPITSDLSDNISFALEHADYLIVICSTNTKQSHWVPREIEYFLRNHTRKQVLTVLVDGEPQDVIPDILLKEDRVVKDRDGNETTISVSLEPLSCDYRMPLKKARKEELPRLASALLGCSYDELMNRRRQYQMQRITAIGAIIMAIITAFAGYMFYSRRQVQKALLESMINQSRYLSSESESLYDDEQRILAIQLALAALPSEENPDRPITAEAIRALTNATEAYIPLVGNNFGSVWNYSMDNSIVLYKISDNAKFLAAVDIENYLSIWATNSHTELLNYHFDERITSITFTGENTVVVTYGSHVAAFDILKDSAVVSWTIDTDNSIMSDKPIVTKDGNIVVGTLSGKIFIINPSNGETVKSFTIPLDSEEAGYSVVSDIELSPSEDAILFEDSMAENIGVYNITTGNAKTFRRIAGSLDCFTWIDDNTIIYSVSDESTFNYSFGNVSVTGADKTYVVCINANNGREIWSNECDTNAVTLRSDFFIFPDKNYIALYKSNVCALFDKTTGEILNCYNTNSPIIDVSDANLDGVPSIITSEGSLITPMEVYGPNAIAAQKIFTSDLKDAQINDGVYANQNGSSSIIYYTSLVHDENWEKINGSSTLGSAVNKYYMDDSILAIIDAESNPNSPSLIIIDADEKEVTHTVSLGEGNATDFSIVGAYDEKVYVMNGKDLTPILMEISISNGKVKEIEFPSEGYCSSDHSIMNGSIISYYYDDFNKKMLVEYDVDTGKYTYTNIDEEFYSYSYSPIYSSEQNLYYLHSGEEAKLYSMEEDEYIDIEIPDDEQTKDKVAFSSTSKTMASVLDNFILISSTETGEIITTIPLQGRDVLGMSFTPDGNTILVAYSSNTLCRYNPVDGSLQGRTDAEFSSIFYSKDYNFNFEFDEENHLLYTSYPQSMNIIDTESWIEIAYLPNCIGYSKLSDCFFSYSYVTSDEVSIGYFKRYTVDDLIAKAYEIIGDATLTSEEKLTYGIN